MDDTDILSKKDTRSEETQTDKKLVFFMLFICAYHNVWFINFQQYQDNQTYWESKAWTVIITDLRHCKSYHL